MPDLWPDLIACLELTPAGAADSYRGTNQHLEYHRIFGGQILAQFLAAARLTCPDKSVKSLHTQFVKEGRSEDPVDYDVQCHHRGRSFATLGMTARQATVIATAAVTMHAAEDGPQHQAVAAVPALPGPEHRRDIGMIPWEIRAATDLDVDAAGAPKYEMWMRTPQVDPAWASALTAYATDLTLIGTALRPLPGVGQHGARTDFASAVTSHTVWFHRPFRTDRWLLLRQHSPVLAHGRTFGRGDVLTEDGELVASYAQEAMVRFFS